MSKKPFDGLNGSPTSDGSSNIDGSSESVIRELRIHFSLIQDLQKIVKSLEMEIELLQRQIDLTGLE